MDVEDQEVAPSIYTIRGERKYLTQSECFRFLQAAQKFPPQRYGMALLLLFTGCRISEALLVNILHLDIEERALRLRTLKQRHQRIVWRSVPVPVPLLAFLSSLPISQDGRLFPWSRSTAYRIIKQAMRLAQIMGVQASPKGLRHSFGVNAVSNARESLASVQRWMGHSRLESTAIYLQAVGLEEYQMAQRMWPPTFLHAIPKPAT